MQPQTPVATPNLSTSVNESDRLASQTPKSLSTAGNPVLRSWGKMGLFLAVALILGLGVYFTYTMRREQRNQASYEALYLARTGLETRLKTIFEQRESASDKASKGAESQISSQFDVEKELGKELVAFKTVESTYPKTYGAFQAAMLTGRLFFEHELDSTKKNERALLHFNSALSFARDQEEVAIASLNSGMVLEAWGRCQDAIKHYEKSRVNTMMWLQAEAALGIARCEKAKPSNEVSARAAFDKVIAAYPDTTWATQAKALKP